MRKAAFFSFASFTGALTTFSLHAKCKSKDWDYNWDFRQPSSLVKPNSPDEELKQKTAYEIGVRLVGSEMCIRDSLKKKERFT